MVLKVLGWLLVAVAAIGFALRFIRHDLSPFILDEPQFLFTAHTHGWVSANPLAGTQGLHYGPCYVWLETLLQKLFGPRVEVMLLAQSFLMTASHLCLAWSLSRAFRGGLLLFGLIGALLAAGPCSFFWSRLAWDNPLTNVCASFAVALLAAQSTWLRVTLLGLVLAIAAGTHLMVLPLIALIAGLLLWEGQWRKVLAGCAVALALLGPYLVYLVRHQLPKGPPPRFDLLGALLLEPMRIFTAARASYFFDDDWMAFAQGKLIPGSSLTVVLAIATLAGLVAAVREPKTRRLGLLGLLFWPVYALFCASRGVELHPHYQNPAIWLLPVGMAGLFAGLKSRPWAVTSLAAAVLIFTAGQTLFLVQWLRFIDSNGGTRGIHYSVPLAAQQAEVRKICAAATPLALIENHTAIFPVSLEYLMLIEPTCAGKRVRFCHGTCPTGAPIVSLEYAGGSAQLR
jgi:hypothetical protein